MTETDVSCANEQWAWENGMTIQWARATWWCDCPKCGGAR